MTTLSVRLTDVDDRRAKAAIYGLNQTGRRPHELEEAWMAPKLALNSGAFCGLFSESEPLEFIASCGPTTHR